MNDRSQQLLDIRPEIPSAKVSPEMGDDEFFQNATLRPVIKLQNDLLLAVFSNYITKHKNRFYELTLERRLQYIENAIQKDIKFRNALKGMIIGQFGIEEYGHYIQNSSNLNKRMMNMVIKRIQDQLQYFDTVKPMISV
ncbi:glyoxalase [Maribacter sp. 2-571]|uniref:glyoxalase n=1 Tax=Maribacter sp. 2-571 TaxID=3417569 RepID=UPI003D33921E